jgi:hypothetical protein
LKGGIPLLGKERVGKILEAPEKMKFLDPGHLHPTLPRQGREKV